MRRLQKELNELQKMKEQGIEVVVKESLYRWEVLINGPVTSPFEGHQLVLDVQFPQHYPFKFPEVRFITPIWHPNVKEGQLCKEMIGQLDWEPSKNMKWIIESILSMLLHPEVSTAINNEAAIQCNNGQYFEIAKKHIQNNTK